MSRLIYLSLLSLAALVGGSAFSWRPRPEESATVTYAKDIAPIINRSCVSCHHDNSVAPFSLIGYDNAKKWASNIAVVTGERVMPPWKAAPGYGEFLDDHQLSDDEIALLKKWYDGGAPRGDKSLEPKAPAFTSEWPLGTPDLILQPEKPFHVAAEGDDIYRNFVLKNKFEHELWVKAIDVKPGNPKVVHHEITFIDGMGASKGLEEANRDGQEGYTSSGGGVGFLPTGTLGGWAPGLTSREMPPGIAYRLKPGSTLVMQVHYHKDGKPEDDLTRLGLYFAKEPIKKEMRLHWIFNFGIDIPPGEKEYHASQTFTVPADVTMYSAMPHMHLLGRSMKADITFPDGTVKPLIWIRDWDFNWQLSYAFKEPLHVPKGSVIHVEATYNNSRGNPRNPNDPPKEVKWGEQTTDEMFLLILSYTLDSENL